MARYTGIRRALVAVACAGSLAIAAAPASAASLYTGPGHRPGPDILYRGPASSPQLQNAGPWTAAPILVSGSQAYRSGEFLYQDWLYDDHGAASGPPEPTDPKLQNENVSPPNGRYTYPSDSKYANNAADLVEFRVKPLAKATAFRITLNTMLDPNLVASTIAIGASDTPKDFPHGANASAPAQLFLTVHGTHADLLRASDGTAITPTPSVSVSSKRRQIQVLVPHKAWNPRSHRVRFAMGTGLWDQANDRYLLPGPLHSSTAPGGSGTLANPPAFFNVAFRRNEPLPDIQDLVAAASDTAWWRDRAQGAALAQGDLSPFHADVSFAKLHRGATDNSSVPKRGAMDRIFASHFERGQGIDWSTTCGRLTGGSGSSVGCLGEYLGRLQPYAIYVPRKPMPRRGWGMTLLMHSLAANYNQYLGSRHQSQFGERAQGSIVITSEARGPDGGYQTLPEADVFEAWADAARRYKLDPGFTSVAGYSMGGFGTFRLAAQFPDLFARAQPTVGAETNPERLASLRNVPVLMWNGLADELVNPVLYLPDVNELDNLGYRFESDIFVPGEHLSLAVNDQYKPAADFLGAHRVNRNPFHVTYAVDPELNTAAYGIAGDHAYWTSAIRLRDATGKLDAFSHGFGLGDPTPSPTATGGGALAGGAFLDPYPFTSRTKTWAAAPRIKTRNRIDLNTTGISSLAINVARARVKCTVKLAVTADGPLTVRLPGCNRTARFG